MTQQKSQCLSRKLFKNTLAAFQALNHTSVGRHYSLKIIFDTPLFEFLIIL